MSTKSRRENSSGISVYLPVTPMLDMTFQLLFFFVSTFNYKPVEGQIPMKMPADGCRSIYDPVPTPPEGLKDKITIVVHAEGGDYKLFDVKAEAFSKLSIPDLNGVSKTLDVIPIKNKFVVYLEVQENLSYSRLVAIMDTLRQAGFVDFVMSGISKEKT